MFGLHYRLVFLLLKAISEDYIVTSDMKGGLFYIQVCKFKPFHYLKLVGSFQVTKVLGNEWSSLSLENRKEYLEKAEVDKKRYREELKVYRNSETYRSYLKRRRIRSKYKLKI